MMKNDLQIATFGAGCFWGVEGAFRRTKGVVSTVVGYMGGELENPTYEDICSGTTGYVEVVQIKFNPSEISYEGLLDVFWKIHDPTQFNRQGVDVGSQYGSVIFFHTPEQEKIAQESKEKMDQSGRFSSRIVTEIIPASKFYKAEEYHQRYLEKRGRNVC